MYKTRLLKLADLLETVEADKKLKKKFDMDTWISITNLYDIKDDKQNITVNASCDYAGCACGWAASDPWFIQQGFVAFIDKEYGEHVYLEFSEFDKEDDEMYTYQDWDAVERFFDLNDDDSETLFSSYNYRNRNGDEVNPTPGRVAKRIRKFVSGKTISRTRD